MLYVIGALVIGLLASLGVGGCEHKEKVAALAQVEAVKSQYAAFRAETERKGLEAQRKAAEEKARNEQIVKEGTDALKAQIAKLRADNRHLDNGLRHYRELASSAVGGGVPKVSAAASGPGSGKPDGVDVEAELSRLRAEVAELRPAFTRCIADGSETAALFASCRDRWKAIAGSALQQH